MIMIGWEDCPPSLHLAMSQMLCWSGGRGMLTQLSLRYSIVYQYNGTSSSYRVDG